MRYLWSFLVFLMIALAILCTIAYFTSCAPKPNNEMEQICHDVIQRNRGVSVTFEPIEEKK